MEQFRRWLRKFIDECTLGIIPERAMLYIVDHLGEDITLIEDTNEQFQYLERFA